MVYSSVYNPRWANAEHTRIDCDVVFNHLGPTPVPFTAVASGDQDYTHEIYANCLAGHYGTITDYTPPPQSE